jgi:Dickkopf-like protein
VRPGRVGGWHCSCVRPGMRKLLTASLLLALACSGDDPASETPTSFCSKWAEAACSDDTVSACQAADVDQCRGSQLAFCLDLVPTAGFSGSTTRACLDAIGSAYADADLTGAELDTVLRLGAPCDRLVAGPRSEGQLCSSRADCNAPDGFDCVFKGTDSMGTCQVPRVVGAGLDCSDQNAVCGEGFYCNGQNCIGGQSVGMACTTDRQCSLDAYCAQPSGLCADRLDVGAQCSIDAECAAGLCYPFMGGKVCTDRIRLSRSEPICADLR